MQVGEGDIYNVACAGINPYGNYHCSLYMKPTENQVPLKAGPSATHIAGNVQNTGEMAPEIGDPMRQVSLLSSSAI